MTEILQALKSMQFGKITGPDCIPVELYKHCAAELAPRLHTLFAASMQLEGLPDTMREAVIVVIPKPGKDPSMLLVPPYFSTEPGR